MQFNADVNGHTIVMDAPARVGGEDKGPIPKPFILTALSGCTGMDVVALLRKSGIFLSDFQMKVRGELSKQQPLEYVAIHMIYSLSGDPGHQQDVLNAITDSQEKICGVSHMLKKAMPVTWEIIYNQEIIFPNHSAERKSVAGIWH